MCCQNAFWWNLSSLCFMMLNTLFKHWKINVYIILKVISKEFMRKRNKSNLKHILLQATAATSLLMFAGYVPTTTRAGNSWSIMLSSNSIYWNRGSRCHSIARRNRILWNGRPERSERSFFGWWSRNRRIWTGHVSHSFYYPSHFHKQKPRTRLRSGRPS